MSMESMFCELHKEFVDWSKFEFKGCWGCHYFSGLDPWEYVYVSEAAEILGVSGQTIRRWIKAGILEGTKYIRQRTFFTLSAWQIYVINRDSVEKVLSKRQKITKQCKKLFNALIGNQFKSWGCGINIVIRPTL